MGIIPLTIIILGAIGLIAAALLYVAAKRFHVYENPKIAQIEALLPGANCGGCGLTGCHAFAKAAAEATSLEGFNCTGAGPDIMSKVSAIVGLDAKAATPKVAIVRCEGSCSKRKPSNNYDGVSSCAIEAAFYQGESDCVYGCLGCGDCVDSCIFDAIHINPETRLPEVDFSKCVGCGKCVRNCPRGIIELVEHKKDTPLVWVACRNRDKGVIAMKECDAACIGCGLCARNCGYEAISLTSFLATIDASKCVACGACIDKCPRHIIEHTGTLHPERQKTPAAPSKPTPASQKNPTTTTK